MLDPATYQTLMLLAAMNGASPMFGGGAAAAPAVNPLAGLAALNPQATPAANPQQLAFLGLAGVNPGANPNRPPKDWWDSHYKKSISAVKREFPELTKDEREALARQRVGHIWYHVASPEAKQRAVAMEGANPQQLAFLGLSGVNPATATEMNIRFRCASCGRKFIEKTSGRKRIVCPQCGGRNIEIGDYTVDEWPNPKDSASSMVEKFTGRPARRWRNIPYKRTLPVRMYAVAPMYSVWYDSDKFDGVKRRYYHRTATPRPVFCVPLSKIHGAIDRKKIVRLTTSQRKIPREVAQLGSFIGFHATPGAASDPTRKGFVGGFRGIKLFGSPDGKRLFLSRPDMAIVGGGIKIKEEGLVG